MKVGLRVTCDPAVQSPRQGVSVLGCTVRLCLKKGARAVAQSELSPFMCRALGSILQYKRRRKGEKGKRKL